MQMHFNVLQLTFLHLWECWSLMVLFDLYPFLIPNLSCEPKPKVVTYEIIQFPTPTMCSSC
jgi:hypothetical protein